MVAKRRERFLTLDHGHQALKIKLFISQQNFKIEYYRSTVKNKLRIGKIINKLKNGANKFSD